MPTAVLVLPAEHRFDPQVAPTYSRWVPPKWMLQHASNPPTPRRPNANGLGEEWQPKKPSFRGIDLTKPDPRIRVPDIAIASDVSDEQETAFVDVNILDSTGKEPYRGDVLVRGKRIVSVGEEIAPEVLARARVIQGNGRTLMSGLCDAHTHFTWTNAASLDGLADMPVEEHTLFSARSARTFLDCGYTMCFGAASAKSRIDAVVKNAINAGDIPGPRALANAAEMAPHDGALVPGITRFVETPEEIEAAINEFADQGADQIKLSMSGEEITEVLRAEDTTFPDELVAAGVEAAHARGLRVCSHARSDESIMQCLQYGVDMIYHASFISDSTMEALEAQRERVFVAPALAWLVCTLEDAEAYGYPPSKAESAGYARELAIAIPGLKEMKKRGIRVMPGGDYGFAWTPHGTYRDPELFVKRLGYTPMEAILAATALGGELLLHPEELGKVQPGYYADMILVNGNPLEDITLLSHHENLDLIMINGRIHKEQLKDRSEARYEPKGSLFNEIPEKVNGSKKANGKE
ncbi:hypothetical protein NBRC10512_005634 [Rhodotorula toruloides]|uniref:RHTO0S15e00958g1_1 n=2 Tax=Rhodotorula toruloides TaxID=5286 RepID=A0A061BEC8_RHOTO|nr:amidohydrolase [Rhodotorula toruloides NP11]EMS25534.1 amidohydrolase [Rhodotorula toruloides NP11]CDR47721.1 RHTO0S15e00958g1_1 [Rhodotorula toruloides]